MQKGKQVDILARLPGRIVTGEAQGRGDHILHLLEIDEHFALLFLVLDKLGAQAQARNRCAQVVGYGRDHLRAVLDEAADAVLHLVEGADGVAHLPGPGFGEGRGVHVQPQAFGGARKAGEGGAHARDDEDRKKDDAEDHHAHRDHQAQGPETIGGLDRRHEIQPAGIGQLDGHHDHLAVPRHHFTVRPHHPPVREAARRHLHVPKRAGAQVANQEIPFPDACQVVGEGFTQDLGSPIVGESFAYQAFLAQIDPQVRIVGEFDDTPPFARRRVLDEPHHGHDAFADVFPAGKHEGGGAVGKIERDAERVRNREPQQQDEQGAPGDGIGNEASHARSTAAVKM